MKDPKKTQVYKRCPKKRGISEFCSVSFNAQMMLNLDYSFLINFEIEIHMFVASTEPFLMDIIETRNRSFKYPI